LILVTDFKWYQRTKADNIGLSCVHKLTAKDLLCCKAYYHCLTCTTANGGVCTVFVCFNCAVGGNHEGDSSPRGAKIPVTKRIQLSNGEVVDARTITSKGGSFHTKYPTSLSKFHKQQEMKKDQKAEKVEQSNPSDITEGIEQSGVIVQITSSESSFNTAHLTRMYLAETVGGSAALTMVQIEQDKDLGKGIIASEYDYLMNAENKRLKSHHSTPLQTTKNAMILNSDGSSNRNLSSSFMPSPLDTISIGSSKGFVPADVTVGAVNGNPFLDSDAAMSSATTPSTPGGSVGSMISELFDMSPLSNSMLHPSVIDVSVINQSMPPPSLPSHPVRRTLEELITDCHVVDNGEPPQANGKLFRYYCRYCHGPVQIGFCNCEIGKKYAYR
jgi:hypothetical protein